MTKNRRIMVPGSSFAFGCNFLPAPLAMGHACLGQSHRGTQSFLGQSQRGIQSHLGQS
jgi:hypothetical protein